MADDDWHTDDAAAIAVYLSGDDLVDLRGRPVSDDSFYLALNATADPLTFRLPDGWLGATWSWVFDTAAERPFETRAGEIAGPATEVTLADRSMVLARRVDAR
jgi:glycogen operon protein